MHFIIKFAWIYALLWTVGYSNSQAQSIEQIRVLIQKKAYEQAKLDISFLEFQNKSSHELTLLSCQIALQENNLEILKSKLLALEEENLQKDSLRFAYRNLYAFYAFSIKKYHLALEQIALSEYYHIDSLLFLKIICLNELEQWEQAAQCFEKFLINKQLDPQLAYSLYNKENSCPYKKKKAHKAQLLNRIFPGLGQLYAGYPLRAMSSLALHLGAGAFVYASFAAGYPISGFIIGANLFFVFNSGGGRHAAFLANRQNTKRKAKFTTQINRILSEKTVY